MLAFQQAQIRPVEHLFGDVTVVWLISANANDGMHEIRLVADDRLGSIESALMGRGKRGSPTMF